MFKELVHGSEILESYISQISHIAIYNYFQSSVISSKLAITEKMEARYVIGDVLTVLGCPGTTMAELSCKYFNQSN